MDAEQISYRTAVDSVRFAIADGCALCTMLGCQISRIPDGDTHIEFVLELDREEDENGPSPKGTPRLRMRASSSSAWTEYCLYTFPGTSCIPLSR